MAVKEFEDAIRMLEDSTRELREIAAKMARDDDHRVIQDHEARVRELERLLDQPPPE